MLSAKRESTIHLPVRNHCLRTARDALFTARRAACRVALETRTLLAASASYPCTRAAQVCSALHERNNLEFPSSYCALGRSRACRGAGCGLALPSRHQGARGGRGVPPCLRWASGSEIQVRNRELAITELCAPAHEVVLPIASPGVVAPLARSQAAQGIKLACGQVLFRPLWRCHVQRVEAPHARPCCRCAPSHLQRLSALQAGDAHLWHRATLPQRARVRSDRSLPRLRIRRPGAP